MCTRFCVRFCVWVLVRWPQSVTPPHHSFLPPLVYQILWMVRVPDGHGTFHHLLHQCIHIPPLTPPPPQELDTPSLLPPPPPVPLPPPPARPHAVVVNASIWLLPKHFNLVPSSFVFPVCWMSFQYLWALSLALSTLLCDCWRCRHYISVTSLHPPTHLPPSDGTMPLCVCTHTQTHFLCVHVSFVCSRV